MNGFRGGIRRKLWVAPRSSGSVLGAGYHAGDVPCDGSWHVGQGEMDNISSAWGRGDIPIPGWGRMDLGPDPGRQRQQQKLN